MTLTAREVARAVRAGELRQVETVEQALRALEAHAELNAVITLCAEEALARAQEAVGGPLAGVPLLVKDVFDTAGIRTTAGSRIFAERVPRTSAATVRTLEAAGAIVVAKTNCDEFAWGVTGQNYFYGDCGNRGDPAESPAARAAATPPGWPPGWRRWRSEATPAARCGCRPRAARSEG